MEKKTLRHMLLVGGALSASAFAWTSGAAAQDGGDGEAARASEGTGIEEIFVTARRRQESLQTTPVAITAVTADTLEKRNVLNLEQVALIAPSYRSYPTSGGIGSGYSWIRGIGFGQGSPDQDPPVGIYMDGIAITRSGNALMELVEPEQVQVLRGPQGTLFGRNTTGGAILVTSHTPTDEFSGTVKGSYGNFNTRRVQARIDSGLLGTSGLKFSAAYSHDERDGVNDIPSQPNSRDPGAKEHSAYWFKMVGSWDRLSAVLTADHSVVTGYPTLLQLVVAGTPVQNLLANSPGFGGKPYTVTPDIGFDNPHSTNGPEQRLWSNGVALTLDYEVSDYLQIKSISAIRGYKRNDPANYGPEDVAAPQQGTGTILHFNGLFELPERIQRQRSKSQELQFLGSAGDFDYVGGAYYFTENTLEYSLTRLPSVVGTGPNVVEVVAPRAYTVSSKSTALFAQGDWRPSFLDKKLELTGGVRWTHDKREFIELVGLLRNADLESYNTSFLTSVSYQWTPNFMTYFKYSTGYRSGGFNGRAGAAVDPVYRPENLKSWEAGFKLDAFQDRLRLNAAAYYNKYENLQVTQFLPPTAGGGGGNEARNADATYKGFEVELETRPIDALTFTLSAGYIDPEYQNYPVALAAGNTVSPACSPIFVNGALLAQNCAEYANFPFFPKVSGSASVNYEFPAASYGTWSMFVSYYYSGEIEMAFFRAPRSPFSEHIVQEPYGLLGARLSLSDIPLSGNVRGQIALFGNNLTNETYDVQGLDFFSFATKTLGEPRTFGIEGKVQF